MGIRRHLLFPAGAGLAAALWLFAAGCGAAGSAQAPARDGNGSGATGSTSAAAPRNLVIILVDTWRADAAGFSGADRPLTPELDRQVRDGVVFEHATTPAGWTRPAVVSLMTGLYPATHGVQDKDHVAPPDIETLAEVLAARGYHTAAFVTNYAASADFGLDQGFGLFRFFEPEKAPRPVRGRNYWSIGEIDPEVSAFLDSPPPEPFFVYIHTTDPHYPYVPPDAYRRFGTGPRDLYDGEVRYTDHFVSSWLERLRRAGLFERSVVVLTADHGEEFHEHGGEGHGVTVFEECVRVPLVVWAPGLPPGRREALVSLADVAPTVLEALRIPRPDGFGDQGRSFWSVALGAGRAAAWSWAYSELVYPDKGVTFGYREGADKVVRIVEDARGRRNVAYLFRVADDPFEQEDLKAREPARFREMLARMDAIRRDHVARAIAPQRRELEGRARDRMKGLGYVQ